MRRPILTAILIAAALASATGAGEALARALTEGSDTVPAHYPAAAARYRALLTPAQRRMPWLARFEGVTAPVHEIDFGDRTMLMGWSCKPHDCGDNQVTILFTRTGSRVVARILTAAHESFAGAPTAREQACMRAPHDGPDDSDRC